jgi:hypothetical protein
MCDTALESDYKIRATVFYCSLLPRIQYISCVDYPVIMPVFS